MNRKGNSPTLTAQCDKCGQVKDAATFHGHRCGSCRSIERWTRGVIIFCVVLILGNLAALAHAEESRWQVYSDVMSDRMGLPKAALVYQYRFPSASQRGESRVGLKAGELYYYIRLGKRFLARHEDKPEQVENTIRHEICHMIAFTELQTTHEGGKFHGPTWKRCAARWDVETSGVVLD